MFRKKENGSTVEGLKRIEFDLDHMDSYRNDLHLNFTTLQLPQQNNRPKASNLPATALIIGDWKCESCNTGDLIAKIYYGRRRLVWEVLVGAFKWKMEINWSHIIGIKFADHQRGILQIQLNQPPSFFRETHTQPRKHTTWEPSHDFTGGHALVSRIHCLEFPPKTLDKHYVQLLQCDERLLALSSSQTPILFPSQKLSSAYNYFNDYSHLLNQAQGTTRFPPQQYLTNYPTSTADQDFAVSPAVINLHQHQHQTNINWNLIRSTEGINIVQGGETLMLGSDIYVQKDLEMDEMKVVDDDDDTVKIMEDWKVINGMSPQECVQWLMMTPQAK